MSFAMFSTLGVVVYALMWIANKLNDLPAPPELGVTTKPIFCVGSEGGAYEGRGWEVIGIHAGNANNYSIGICLIGDWRTELPHPLQLETTKALIQAGVKRGAISPEYKLIGHRQAMATECPGGALYNLITTWDHYVPVFEIPKL